MLSSAGWPETMRLCDDVSRGRRSRRPGQLSFVESISILDASRASWATTARSSSSTTREKFHCAEARRAGRRAQRRDLLAEQLRLRRAAGRGRGADHGAGQLRPLGGAGRRTSTGWRSSAGTTGWSASAVRFVPDFRRAVIDTDMFTPTTIRRFTGHENGAVYGAAEKRCDGTHAPEEPLHLRHRPGLGRHRRRDHQRHRHGQPALAEACSRGRRRRVRSRRHALGESLSTPNCDTCSRPCPRIFCKDARDRYDVRRHRQRAGRADGGQHAGPRRPLGAAARAALQAGRPGHLVPAAAAGTSSTSRCTAFPWA